MHVIDLIIYRMNIKQTHPSTGSYAITLGVMVITSKL